MSLEVPEGSIVTVLGSNGAGKTTILKTISGILDARKGTLHFAGAPIQGLEPDAIVRRGLSHVPEGREVFPLLTVRENLLMGAYTRGDDGVGRDFDRMYGYFPILRERSGQEAGQLSGAAADACDCARADVAAEDVAAR